MELKVIRTVLSKKEKHDILKPEKMDKHLDFSVEQIVIDPSRSYQKHLGFGGAFTESAAYTLSCLSEDEQEKVIENYFGKHGLRYNLGRTHINSCDFAIENYDYVKPGDKKLESFDISREERWVIPMVKKALKHVPHLKLLASPWSPPAWMKDNNNMNFGGKLLKEYYQTWANYYVKYFEAMEKHGLHYFMVTVQNEPAAKQTWDSCIYSAEEERDFIKDYLGPTIERSKYGVKILGWDHNRDIIVERAGVILNDPKASKYTWGIGTHWYVSEKFENLSVVHGMFPDKHLVFTEGCQEGGPHPLDLKVAERYARNIIGDLNNFVEGWIDWNLVLDEQGGPNHVGNFCDAPVLIDTKKKEVLYNYSFDYIGHFSKYIEPGARRVHHFDNLSKGLSNVTYQNPDGSLLVVLLNETDIDQKINIVVNNEGKVIDSFAHSIETIMIK